MSLGVSFLPGHASEGGIGVVEGYVHAPFPLGIGSGLLGEGCWVLRKALKGGGDRRRKASEERTLEARGAALFE